MNITIERDVYARLSKQLAYGFCVKSAFNADGSIRRAFLSNFDISPTFFDIEAK